MNELSLFTGAGGGILGTTLLGWKHRGYVEWDDYCQRVIRQRIIDGILDEAPIFCDVRAFIGEGYAASYTGMVDVVTAGFPCQPFSVAGKRKGVDDERNMWPATADVIRIVRPRFVLLENVPGIREYLPMVIRDLRRLGYTVRRPLILGAGDCGAPHKRDRIWIVARDTEGNREAVAHTDSEYGERRPEPRKPDGENRAARIELKRCGNDVSHSECNRLQGSRQEWKTERPLGLCSGTGGDKEQKLSDALLHGSHRTEGHEAEPCSNGKDNRVSFGNREWPVEPDVGRVAHGVASRVDRLKAIGNGQVPRVVAAAWKLLNENLGA
jgi:DNA (cytosine-5)-methyltransferase 1